MIDALAITKDGEFTLATLHGYAARHDDTRAGLLRFECPVCAAEVTHTGHRWHLDLGRYQTLRVVMARMLAGDRIDWKAFDKSWPANASAMFIEKVYTVEIVAEILKNEVGTSFDFFKHRQISGGCPLENYNPAGAPGEHVALSRELGYDLPHDEIVAQMVADQPGRFRREYTLAHQGRRCRVDIYDERTGAAFEVINYHAPTRDAVAVQEGAAGSPAHQLHNNVPFQRNTRLVDVNDPEFNDHFAQLAPFERAQALRSALIKPQPDRFIKGVSDQLIDTVIRSGAPVWHASAIVNGSAWAQGLFPHPEHGVLLAPRRGGPTAALVGSLHRRHGGMVSW